MRPAVAPAVLVLVTVAWGASFVVMKHGLDHAEPLGFVAVRFGVAAVAVALATGRSLAATTRTEVGGGVAIGLALAAGNGLQSVGLSSINSSTSAFLTALYVPLVPVLAWLFTKRAPSTSSWAAISLAFVGVWVLSGVSATTLGLGTGEAATLLGALAIAGEILLLGRFAPRVDVKRITVVQLATCALASGFAAPLLGEAAPQPSWGLAATAGVLGLGSAMIQLAMTWAQSSLSPVTATVIYAGEPVWAGLFAGLLGERFSDGFVLGGALIVLSLLLPAIARVRPLWRPSRRQTVRTASASGSATRPARLDADHADHGEVTASSDLELPR